MVRFSGRQTGSRNGKTGKRECRDDGVGFQQGNTRADGWAFNRKALDLWSLSIGKNGAIS